MRMLLLLLLTMARRSLLVQPLVELSDEALGRSDDGRRVDLATGRHPVDGRNAPVGESPEDGRRRADVAAPVLQLVDAGHERPVQLEDVADALLQHRRVADDRTRQLHNIVIISCIIIVIIIIIIIIIIIRGVDSRH